MNIIKTHFQNYQKLTPFRFCIQITLESVLLSFIVASIIEIFWGVPIRSFVNLPNKRLFILLVISAPLIETLMFQAIPISIIKWLKFSFSIQIIIPFLLFSIAHFLVGWQVGISAGIIAGFYLAFTYAHWISKSHLTAFWTTTLSHSIRNFIAFIFILIFLPQFEEKSIQYDFFTNQNLGTVWHFYDKDEEFIFSIVDEDLRENLEFDKNPNRLFYSEFSLSYHNRTINFRYNREKSKIYIDGKEFSTKEYNIFFLDFYSENFKVDPFLLNLKLSNEKRDISEVPQQIEKELWKRAKLEPKKNVSSQFVGEEGFQRVSLLAIQLVRM